MGKVAGSAALSGARQGPVKEGWPCISDSLETSRDGDIPKDEQGQPKKKYSAARACRKSRPAPGAIQGSLTLRGTHPRSGGATTQISRSGTAVPPNLDMGYTRIEILAQTMT